MLLRIPVVAFVVMVLLAAAQSGPASGDETSEESDSLEMVELMIGGGTVTVPQAILDAGSDRFLSFVEPPTFNRTEEALQNPELQPGDGGDEGLVVTDRRETDYDYLKEPWTGGMRVEGVHGGPGGYLCVCDVELRLVNESGLNPAGSLNILSSSYIWVDNVTIYGALTHILDTDNTITSNSKFIDSDGVWGSNAKNGYVHNITVTQQRGPANILHAPPDPLGLDIHCFPHNAQPCQTTSGVSLAAGINWTVEWSYFHQASVAPITAADMVVRHNTFRQGVPGVVFGDNEISWNLVRDYHSFGIIARSPDTLNFHNNSIFSAFKIDTLGLSTAPGIFVTDCQTCKINANDFVGYGPKRHASGSQFGDTDHNPALFGEWENSIQADDNYWGTLHDPQLPPGVWIDVGPDTELTLDRWETEPIHDITPVMWTVDQNDPPAWGELLVDFVVEETTNNLP